jgi:hypothetical protein
VPNWIFEEILWQVGHSLRTYSGDACYGADRSGFGCGYPPPPPGGYFGSNRLVFNSLQRVRLCKIFIANGLRLKYFFSIR